MIKPYIDANLEAYLKASASKNQESKKASDKKAQDNNVSNVLMLSFILLLEAVGIGSQSAEIKAKTLAAQAGAEQKLNNEMRQANWGSVPVVKHTKKHHVKVDHWTKNIWATHHWDWKFWKNDILRKEEYITVQGKIANLTAIYKANFDNVEKNKWREDLQSQISIVEQNAQGSQTTINSAIDETERSTQEASSLLDMLGALTMQILHKGS